MAGTYSDQVATRFPPAQIGECPSCPEHHYCGFAATTPALCPAGTYCPEGRGYPLLCPVGKYCQPRGDTVGIASCPQGSYCPVGTADPIPCQAALGQVCAPGSASPLYSAITAESCGPGTFFGYGQCNPCVEGFVCEGRTTERFPLYQAAERGYECPTGQFCPAASSSSLSCPPGSYRATTKATATEDCALCPEGSFNTASGQSSCSVCGRGATSSADRLGCYCLGAFRTWRESTRSCVCQSGYLEPNITQASQTSAENNDCVPLLDPKCSGGFHRDD